ncbi:HlyD family efflux transporter periplasmic adaptor subunit [Gaetbulibacter sp. M235]|uniref:HlyD family secretion protein n=1 Tax=Gaetbulibacter sp. M235 TaxID=3126510 RepID=UPI00374F384D
MQENKFETQIRSEEVQDILSKVPHWMIRWGNVLFLSLIIMLLVISWFIKYPDVIVSEALITTQIPPQKVFAKTNGKFDVIMVKDNELVNINQPLAIIENTANYNDVFKLASIVDTIPVNNQMFNFPITDLPFLFLGDIETSYALFENNYIQYILNKKLQPFTNENFANKLSIYEINERLQNLESQKQLNQSELQFKKKALERNKELFEKGVISTQEYESKQLEFLQSERNFKNINVSISQLQESKNNALKALRDTDINKIKQEMTLLKKVIQSFNQLKKSIKEWEAIYVLKSKINGRVTFLNYWNKNQVVNQDALVFSIIPSENSSFIAKLKIPTLNSGKIKVGQLANIKIDNYPEAEFGTLKSKIVKVSIFPDKDGLYLIDASLPKELITSYNKKIEFKQEMSGSAEIITEDLHLIERFFYQIKNVFKD